MSRIFPAKVSVLLLLFQYVALDSDIISHFTREKCIEGLGCFDAKSPFFDVAERPISLLPDDREDINTTFLLYTPRNPKVPTVLSNIHGNVSDILKSSAFNPEAEVKFVVPGFLSRTSPEWKGLLVETLVNSGGSNVFLVDWSGSDGPFYEQAVANTRVVGAEIAVFITHLEKSFGTRPDKIHIIGHSLGAHIAGYAGKRVKHLGRITGMDPAGPYFTNVDPIVRLDRGDAQFVDVIHTNAAPTRFQGFGLTQSIGHFDFYPNGGHLQPGCKDMGHAIWSFIQNPSFDPEGLKEIQCNHKRATQLFISSISNSRCELFGVVCENFEKYLSGECGSCGSSDALPKSCVPMGINAVQFSHLSEQNKSINLYLNTTATEPFCMQ